jgi:hypothetical protein
MIQEDSSDIKVMHIRALQINRLVTLVWQSFSNLQIQFRILRNNFSYRGIPGTRIVTIATSQMMIHPLVWVPQLIRGNVTCN